MNTFKPQKFTNQAKRPSKKIFKPRKRYRLPVVFPSENELKRWAHECETCKREITCYYKQKLLKIVGDEILTERYCACDEEGIMVLQKDKKVVCFDCFKTNAITKEDVFCYIFSSLQ